MGISFVTEPREYTPAFNNIVFIVDSTNKNEKGFRYVVQVLDKDGNKIYESRIAPRIGDGYGFIQLEKVIQSKIEYNLDLTNTTIVETPKAFFEFEIKIGEEFIYNWSYDDFEYRGGNKVALNSTITHAFNVGDQITVSQNDGGAEKPMLNGLFTIVEIPNDTEIILNIGWDKVGSGSTIGGSVMYSDNRTLIQYDLLSTWKTAYNSALSFLDFANYNDDNCKLTDVNPDGEMLTNIDNNFYCSIDSIMFLNYGNAAGTIIDKCYFENNLGGTYLKSISVSDSWNRLLSCGPLNFGGDETFLDGIDYYDFYFITSGGSQITKPYRVNIDKRCEIEETKILFLDLKGSFIPFSFALRTYEKGEIERTSFKKEIKENSTYNYSYNKQFQGGEVTSVHVNKTFKLTSNWLNDSMSRLFEELVTSPIVLIYYGGVWQSCEILDNSFDVDKQKNKKMIKKSINVRLLNQNNINV
jgi:hypothetical protein